MFKCIVYGENLFERGMVHKLSFSTDFLNDASFFFQAVFHKDNKTSVVSSEKKASYRHYGNWGFSQGGNSFPHVSAHSF